MNPTPFWASVVCDLTSWVSAKDEFSDFIVNKDKETVWERTEPPTGPEKEQGVMDRMWAVFGIKLRNKTQISSYCTD